MLALRLVSPALSPLARCRPSVIPRLGRTPGLPAPAPRVQRYGPAVHAPPVPPPIPGTPAGFWLGRRASTPAAPCHSPARRSRIGLDASSQLLMAPPSPEQSPHMSGEPPVAPNSQSTELARMAPVQPCPLQAPQAHSQVSGGSTSLRSPSARASPAEPPIRPGTTHRPQSRPAPASHLSKPPQIPIAIQHPFVTHLIL